MHNKLLYVGVKQFVVGLDERELNQSLWYTISMPCKTCIFSDIETENTTLYIYVELSLEDKKCKYTPVSLQCSAFKNNNESATTFF